MTNFKNDYFYKISNAKQTIPVSANITGTISTDGIYVIGVGTDFLTNSTLMADGWITDLTNNEIRKVKSVASDTRAELYQAFTADLALGTTPNVISREKLNIKEIGVIIPLSNSVGAAYTFGEIDGVELESGLPIVFGKASKDNENGFSYIDPLIADATGTVINVTILK